MPSSQFQIPGQPDFELGSDRSHPVTLLVETPETEAADGLVFIIPGMGGETDAHYSSMIRRYIADKYNIVAVSVDAHCNTCRPNLSTEFGKVELSISPNSLVDALGQYVAHGGKLETQVKTHNEILSLLKQRPDLTFAVNATLVPPGGQYQNFGVLSALDHLAALNFLIDQPIAFDTGNVLCLGSSHGGYIAHVMHKFAPNTFNGIIDASAYTETQPTFVDGRWLELALTEQNITFQCSTVQKWQFGQHGEATFFGADRSLIRDVVYDSHLAEVAAKTQRSCQFRMIHSGDDRISPPHLKTRQAAFLESYGFDVHLDVIGEADVDGKFIKSADHGMGIALNLLFDKYYPTLARRPGKLDRELETHLTFNGPKMSYCLKHMRNQIHLDATCRDIEPSVPSPVHQQQPVTV